MRGEKIHHFIIVKSKPACAQVLGICSQVQLAAKDARLQLHGAITTVAVTLQDSLQIGQEEYVDAGIGREFLIETEMAGLIAEIATFQEL